MVVVDYCDLKTKFTKTYVNSAELVSFFLNKEL